MNNDTGRLLARIARLEAQADIRGRAVVIYRERAREADEAIDAWRKQYEYDTDRLWDELDAAEARIKAAQDALSFANMGETLVTRSRIRRALNGDA